MEGDAEFVSAESIHMFGFRLRREGEKADLFSAFDRLLHLLDDDNPDLAFAARQVLVDAVCQSLSPKERVLKCGEALTWYSRGVGGISFLAGEALDALSSLSEDRARGEVCELLQSVAVAAFALKEGWVEVASELDALARLALQLDAERGTEVVLQLMDEHASLIARWTSLLESANPRLLRRGAFDGRVVHLLLVVIEKGIAAHSLLRPHVFSPLHNLLLAAPVIGAAMSEFCGQPEDPKLLQRARVAFMLGKALVERCKGMAVFELVHWHQWLKSLVLSLVDFSVRCPDQAERLLGWNLIELCLEHMSVETRGEAYGHLLENCPFATVVALVVGKLKGELVRDTSVWWPLCSSRLLWLAFRVPKNSSELSSRHDAIVAALNLLLFLAIRSGKQETRPEFSVVARARHEYLEPLERLLSARIAQAALPMDLDHQNKLMKTVSEHQWTEDSLREAQQKTLVTDELCMSIIRRIESFL
jgi:hypothetical protein